MNSVSRDYSFIEGQTWLRTDGGSVGLKKITEGGLIGGVIVTAVYTVNLTENDLGLTGGIWD